MKPVLQVLSRGWFLLAFLLFSLVFILPLPGQLIFNGIHITDEVILLSSCVIIFFALKDSRWGWKTIQLALTLVIFTLPILRLWASAESNYYLVLGLLPWSDASGYYADAARLLDGGLFTAFSGHRPLFPALLAVLLKFGNGNFQVISILLAIIVAISVYLFTREIRTSFGPLTGTGMTLLLQIYYRPYAGMLLTEQLGMPLGLIAIASLFYAVNHKNKWLFSGGLFLLTFGLFARAGAFFVLPAILIAGIFLFKDTARLSAAKMGLMFSLTLLAAWGLNITLVRLVSEPDTASLGNFSYTIYGQAVGGKGWTQVFIDHPEINKLTDAQQSQVVYMLALNEILKHPSNLAQSFLTAWKDFFLPGIFAGFGFIQPGDKYSSPIIQIILTIFLFAGIFLCFRHRQQAIHLLLLAFACGIFISIPFIPPSESQNMRIYAATISVPSLLAWIGISGVFPNHPITRRPAPELHSNQIFALLSLGFTLVFLSTAGAVTLKAISTSPPALEPVNCPAGMIPVQVQLSRGAYVEITTNESGIPTSLPTVTARDFRKSLRGFPGVYHNFSDTLLEAVTPPALLTYTRNLLSGDFVWLTVPPEQLVQDGKTLRACAEPAGQNLSILSIR